MTPPTAAQNFYTARGAAAALGRADGASRVLQVILTNGSVAYLPFPSDAEQTRVLAIRSDIQEITRII